MKTVPDSNPEISSLALFSTSARVLTITLVAIPFRSLLDPETGRTRVRTVDVRSTRYAIARRYMIRLRRDDFEDPHEMAKFAATVGLSLQEFRDEFENLVEDEPPPLVIDAHDSSPGAAEPAHASA